MSWWRRQQDGISWYTPRPSNAHVSCWDGCSYSCFHLCQRLLTTVFSAHSLQHLRHLLQTHMRDTVMHASHEQPTQQLGRTNRRAFEQKRHRSGPGTGRFSLDGHELAELSVTRQVYPGCCIKNQLMLFGPRLGYGVSKWVLSRTMFPPRMPNGSPEKLGSISRHARSQCMSESQGRSIRGFDRWDFTNEHVEVS